MDQQGRRTAALASLLRGAKPMGESRRRRQHPLGLIVVWTTRGIVPKCNIVGEAGPAPLTALVNRESQRAFGQHLGDRRLDAAPRSGKYGFEAADRVLPAKIVGDQIQCHQGEFIACS
jgi:hypothetical protein